MNENPHPIDKCQIYLITPPHIDDVSAFAITLEQVLKAAPVASLQIRLKGVARDVIVKTTKTLMPLAHAHGTAVILNDDPDIALETGADGVHLGQADLRNIIDIKSAQQMLKPGAIIGVTCHNSKDLAFKAGSGGAHYIAFGSFFESTTKPDAPPANLELLTWWHETMEIPSVAIGGITVDNAEAVIAAGADFIALSSGVWNYQKGPVQSVKLLSDLCARYTRPQLV
ncbi:MAG: thiamine phosphate synthase [Robiginitomaculum sp.]|nr:thiamine phosphate synthase [Robiginitomaculum sp.]